MVPLTHTPTSMFAGRKNVPDRSVIVVDDENTVRELMSRWLQAGGYAVASASGADEALGLMEAAAPAVALCDIRMPGHDGLWLAERIRQQFPETAIIMATGVHDANAASASVQGGVVDYLMKPFGRERLRAAVTRGVEWHRNACEVRSWRERLEVDMEDRLARLHGRLASIAIDSHEAVLALHAALTLADPASREHGYRVAELAVALARKLSLTAADVDIVRQAALLHDIGKLVMPEALLRKPAPLTTEEQSIVRRCPQIAADLLGHFPHLEEAAAVVATMFERPDGLGYPGGAPVLDGPTPAQIVAAVDAYDTMTRSRVFRDALSSSDALLELDRCSGTQFDPQVVRLLKTLVAVH